MVSSWLIKIIVGIAFVGFAVIELGSPLIARAQADDAAHEVADEAALVLGSGTNYEAMVQRCEAVAVEKNVELLTCEVNNDGDVQVRVRKNAISFLLDKWSVTEGWYKVEVSATADPR